MTLPFRPALIGSSLGPKYQLVTKPSSLTLYVFGSTCMSATDLMQARGRHPILAKYANDWATEEIVKQFVKNKRRYAYRNGWLDVPEKYKYLKTNSAKRDPSASRKRRTVATGSTGAAKVSVAIKKAAKAKKIKSKSSGSKSGSRGKGKQVVVSDEEDDDEEMYASEKDEE